MDTMKAIYKILEGLEKSLDEENFDFQLIEHDAIGISECKWNRLITILQNEGLIEGFKGLQFSGNRFPEYKMISPAITFEGIIYLSENSNTAKVINAAKFLKDVIPGM